MALRKALVSIFSAQFFENQNTWNTTLVSLLTENPKMYQLQPPLRPSEQPTENLPFIKKSYQLLFEHKILLVPKLYWTEKICWTQKFFGPINFVGFKIFSDSQYFVDPNFFGPNSFFDPKFFWTQQFFWMQNLPFLNFQNFDLAPIFITLKVKCFFKISKIQHFG